MSADPDADATGRIQEVFLEVEGLSPLERAARLDELCGSDSVLRGEVESLLPFHDMRAPRLPNLSAGMTAPGLRHQATALVGHRIDDYVLREIIGEGGMGQVWLAEQGRPHRRIAIKLMLHRFVSLESQRRFVREVELSGRLKHPGIVAVYGAGSFELDGESLPYFAMEYIEQARTLDAWVRGSKPDWRARVEMMAQVCEAVSHGHQHGVIHRDLKPANILVDGAGWPRVIDFGVARATDPDLAVTQHTQYGQLIGTLRYMSPEQCLGNSNEIGTSSDVYTLGVLLYELLCSRMPYDVPTDALLQAVQVIHKTPPARPSTIDPRFRGDLDAVLLKALEKCQDRRYDSAAALAADLRRWLRGEHVEARPPGRWRQMASWIGRHPLAATVVGCVSIIAMAAVSSLIALQVLARDPAYVQWDVPGKLATLRSRAGVALASWEGGESGSVIACTLLARPPEMGGGKVVVAGFTPLCPNEVLAGHLWCFDAQHPTQPLWSSEDAPFVLPEGERPRSTGRFIIGSLLIADVLPEVPGSEIIASHGLFSFSATCIRVYDLAGRVRYETWNDGQVINFDWLPTPRLLVAGCFDSERRWDERGLQFSASSARYPACALALHPKDDRQHFSTFLARGGRILDPTVAWFRWLGPAPALGPLQDLVPSIAPLTGTWDRSIHTQFLFEPTHPTDVIEPRLFLILDAHGNEVDRFDDDTWKARYAAGKYPASSAYQLFDYTTLPWPKAKAEAAEGTSIPEVK